MSGVISFEAGGKTYQAAFTNSAMAAYEDKFNESFLDVASRFEAENLRQIRVSFLIDLFSFAVRARNRDLCETEIADIIDAIPAGELVQKTADVIQAAFPDVQPEADAGKKPSRARKPARTK
jgi:hypothetical protein